LQQKLNLDLCFELFTTEETLSAQNSWYCKKCKEHQQASKKFDLWCLPKVLVIHLKRFRSVYRINKINEFVDCPVEGLKIYNSRHEEHVYDLVAVSNHMGGLGGGHYTAYAKNRYDNRWYNFDDSYTCHLSGSPVVRPLLLIPDFLLN
uniref:ubiquitinyl hydrolase 1 n=1 Tax=Schistocephalus solidus TaxID=70667 RepID=A0A183T5N6_SCHSO